ncbi:MAG: immune inhibitor A, partial [Bacteroidales bacterium]|nr:immune inhibitor A [Bacteroidales bacterium]
MEFRRKHISTIMFLLLAAGMAFASASGSKIQNILKESTVTIPVLLVEFSDTKFTLEDPEEKFSVQLETAAGYFNANWQGAKTFFFPIVAKVSLDTPIATYGAPSASFNDTDIKQLIADACAQAAEQGKDFSIYDTQGNGTISNIAVIFAGYSESEGGSPNSIWPHQQNLTGQEVMVGDLKVLSYTCTPELSGSSGSTISPIGTFCHEICHWLGLPDMYDTNSEDEGLSPALNGT